MSELIYAKIDHTKTVRFQRGEKTEEKEKEKEEEKEKEKEKEEEEKEKEEERRNTDVCDNIDNVVIYDNCWTEESTPPPKPPDNTTDDQQKTTSVSPSEDIYAKPDLSKKVRFQMSEKKEEDEERRNADIYQNVNNVVTAVDPGPLKRTLPRVAGVFLGLLCLVLLAAVIVLLVLWIQDKSNWAVEKDNWTMERNRLRVNVANLTSEKDRLEDYSYRVMKSYNETKSINHNLTRQIGQLEEEKNLLKTMNNNLTVERDELLNEIETSCCPADWIKYRKSCYFISSTRKNWPGSKKFCEDQSAHLLIISNEEEQKFISSFGLRVWIGLTDEETEGVWKWVDGTQVTRTYWRRGQPDNKAEHCVMIVKNNYKSNWNDLYCYKKELFICEINL